MCNTGKTYYVKNGIKALFCLLCFSGVMLSAADESQTEKLRALYEHEEKVDHKQFDLIYYATQRMNHAIKRAEGQSLEDGLKTLNVCLADRNANLALNLYHALTLKETIIEKLSAQREHKRQVDASWQIKFEEGDGGSFVITKKINADNKWTLHFLPLSAKDDVQKIIQLADEQRSLKKKAKQLEEERKVKVWYGDTSAPSPIVIYNCETAADDAGSKWILLLKSLMKDYPNVRNPQADTCSVSNITAPLLIMAYELISDKTLNVWYTVYIPGKSDNSWILK